MLVGAPVEAAGSARLYGDGGDEEMGGCGVRRRDDAGGVGYDEEPGRVMRGLLVDLDCGLANGAAGKAVAKREWESDVGVAGGEAAREEGVEAVVVEIGDVVAAAVAVAVGTAVAIAEDGDEHETVGGSVVDASENGSETENVG